MNNRKFVTAITCVNGLVQDVQGDYLNSTDLAGLLPPPSPPPPPSSGPIRVATHTTTSTSVGTTETDLYTDTLTPGLLGNNNDVLRVVYGGNFPSTMMSSVTVRVKFDGNTILTALVPGIATAGNYTVVVELVRVSSSVARYAVTMNTGAVTAAGKNAFGETNELTGLTLANAIDVVLTGESAGGGAADGDITAEVGYLEKIPA